MRRVTRRSGPFRSRGGGRSLGAGAARREPGGAAGEGAGGERVKTGRTPPHGEASPPGGKTFGGNSLRKPTEPNTRHEVNQPAIPPPCYIHRQMARAKHLTLLR